ncbi:MAG: hypothetical protein ACK5TO_02975 [Planctomycetaceae bacterium]
MSTAQSVAAPPVQIRVVTTDPAPYARVLPRCPGIECVGITLPTDALRGIEAPTERQRLLIGADVGADAVLSLLGRARQQGLSAWLADGAVLDFAVLDELRHSFAGVGLELQAGQPLRHRPMVDTVRAALRAGQLGEPAIVRIHDWRAAAGTVAVPAGWELRSIRQYADLVCWLLEMIPETVWAIRPTVGAKRESEGLPTETLQFHAGGPGPVMVLCDLAHGLPAGDEYWSLSVIGSRGAAYADDHRTRQLLFAAGTARAECTREGDWPLWQLLQSFLPGRPAETTEDVVREAPGAAALSRAIGQSLQSGASVSLERGGLP